MHSPQFRFSIQVMEGSHTGYGGGSHTGYMYVGGSHTGYGGQS